MIRPVRKIGDNRILTPNQADFLLEFAESELKDVFRLTGGTALSAFFLEHRLSEDLDFFSSEKISIHLCQHFLSGLGCGSIFSATKKFDRNIFLLKHKDGAMLKVEFTTTPCAILSLSGICMAFEWTAFSISILLSINSALSRTGLRQRITCHSGPIWGFRPG